MFKKKIHLLYAPTNVCNLSCNYCYLGKLTDPTQLKVDSDRACNTLETALKKLDDENILAFNLSLHGGEVSVLAPVILENLFSQITNHYRKHTDAIQSLGIRKSQPHIKTNLYKLEPLLELYEKYKVSISASIDLPLRLHAKHRVTQNGKQWLEKTLSNLKLLSSYKYSKKISATFSAEHLDCMDEICDDIEYLHSNIGFDMNQFNIMFAFPSELNEIKKEISVLNPASSDQQLQLYTKLKERFDNTDLHDGVNKYWFEEFTPSYCTNSENCGEKFFLLQSDGSVYSCVRAQGLSDFYYGNIFESSWEQIISIGESKIKQAHQKYGFHSDCGQCSSLSYCNTGCPIVKKNRQEAKSYTCELQKKIYEDYPLTYPKNSKDQQKSYKIHYLQAVHTSSVLDNEVIGSTPAFILPDEYINSNNALLNIIDKDEILKTLFSKDIFKIQINNDFFPLTSQLLKNHRQSIILTSDDIVKIHFSKLLMGIATKSEDILRNTLHLQLLRDTHVQYGSDDRYKQEHLFTYSAFKGTFNISDINSNYYEFDLTQLLKIHSDIFKRGILNNLFITTSALRDYHYNLHKNNAFYHIQTINLPFQNIEFYYL